MLPCCSEARLLKEGALKECPPGDSKKCPPGDLREGEPIEYKIEESGHPRSAGLLPFYFPLPLQPGGKPPDPPLSAGLAHYVY